MLEAQEPHAAPLIRGPHRKQDQVRAFVAAAYGIDGQFGLFTDTLNALGFGMKRSQIALPLGRA